MSLRYYRNGQATSLSDAVTAFDASIEVDQASGFPTQFPYTLIIDPDTLLEEVVDVTSASGTTLTVTRGADGTTSNSHAAGAVVYHGVSARDHAEANSHVNAISGVHGTTGAIVDTASDQVISGNKTFSGTLATSGGPVVSTGGDQTVHGVKIFDGTLATAAGGAVETLGGSQTVTGNKTWSGIETHQGAESHAGTETHTGGETHSGIEVHNGVATFNDPVTFTDTVSIAGFKLIGPLTAYTPLRKNGPAGASLGSGAGGSLAGQFAMLGDKLCYFHFQLILGAGFAVGTGLDWIITTPFAPANFRTGGQAFLFDDSAGTTFNKAWRFVGTSAEIAFFGEAGNRFNSGSPVTWAQNDEIFGHGIFEIA